MVGMWGDAPVTLNWPSFSRLPGAFCAEAETAVSNAAAEAADNRRLYIREPLLHRALLVRPSARRHSHIEMVFPSWPRGCGGGYSGQKAREPDGQLASQVTG